MAVVFTFKTGPSSILQRDTSSMNTTVHFLQGNSDFETTIAVRILLNRFLLTYFQVSTILTFKGRLLLDQTLLLEKPTANLLLLSSWYHLYCWCWLRPPWLADTLQVSNSLLLNVHLPWQPFYLCSFSSEALLPADSFYNKVVSTPSQRTVTTFTANLVQGSGWYVQGKDVSVQASLMWAEEQRDHFVSAGHILPIVQLLIHSWNSRECSSYSVSTSWFSEYFPRGVLHPLQEKSNNSKPVFLLDALLAFGSLQQIHKPDYTTDLELQPLFKQPSSFHCLWIRNGFFSYQVSLPHLLTVKRGARPYMCSLK